MAGAKSIERLATTFSATTKFSGAAYAHPILFRRIEAERTLRLRTQPVARLS